MSIRNVLKAFAFLVLLCAAFTLAPVSNLWADAAGVASTAPPVVFGIPLTTATVLAFMTSVFMPLVSALISRSHWPEKVEGYITLVLATANGFLTEWAVSPDADHYDWKKALVITFISLTLAVLGRLGFWKGTDLTQALSNFPKSVTQSS